MRREEIECWGRSIPSTETLLGTTQKEKPSRSELITPSKATFYISVLDDALDFINQGVVWTELRNPPFERTFLKSPISSNSAVWWFCLFNSTLGPIGLGSCGYSSETDLNYYSSLIFVDLLIIHKHIVVPMQIDSNENFISRFDFQKKGTKLEFHIYLTKIWMFEKYHKSMLIVNQIGFTSMRESDSFKKLKFEFGIGVKKSKLAVFARFIMLYLFGNVWPSPPSLNFRLCWMRWESSHRQPYCDTKINRPTCWIIFVFFLN